MEGKVEPDGFTFLTNIKMIREYIERLKTSRGFSENTIKNYNRTIVNFDRYLKSVSLNRRGANQCEKIKLNLIDSYIKKHRLE